MKKNTNTSKSVSFNETKAPHFFNRCPHGRIVAPGLIFCCDCKLQDNDKYCDTYQSNINQY